MVRSSLIAGKSRKQGSINTNFKLVQREEGETLWENLSGEGSQCFAAGLVVSTGTGFATIVGSVLITFSLSSLIEKSSLSRYSCEEIKLLTLLGNCHLD